MTKKTRVAVIGVGYLGSLHAEKYSAIEEADLVGVVDTDARRAEEIAAKFHTRAYKSPAELDGLVDAVSIVTPTNDHTKIGVEQLLKGVDVLIEKPIAMDTDEAMSLIRVGEKTGAIIQVGHLERFNGAIMALGGMALNPMFIESNRLSPFPNRSTDVDVILDLMIHDIDIILNLVDSEVAGIDAVGIPVITRKVDVVSAHIRFENGCVANITASRVSKNRLREIHLFQTDTCISIDYAHQHISIGRVIHGAGAEPPRMVNEEIDIEKKDSLMEELKAFLKCSATKERPLVSGAEGLKALKVATMVQEAVERSVAGFTPENAPPGTLF